MNKKMYLLAILGCSLVALGFGYVTGYSFGFDAGIAQKIQTTDVYPGEIRNFEDCVLAGNAVMESYPRQCRDEATGELYIETVDVPPIAKPPMKEVVSPTSTMPVLGKCVIGGCSGQLCGEESEMKDLVTTCEFREEYACYKYSQCERQQSGSCGWTQTKELMSCLAKPPAL
ncbi:MAG: hypothetical protein KC582_01405 [Candidatus Magasanikbacteria bacterium]|mgnify:CR=1 FL=1|nr:hypothetical protein [Candidatus Magasanikbacteria bacterium]MCA9390891.1 hypothetical protein [Candidatus Magasanikbacteria bacterium]USN52925.1 MAG: hypothetical protein H6759_02600 [Candidatus Nomurabacteria bacterium]HPF95141.1 hypothetical protein [bacterium]